MTRHPSAIPATILLMLLYTAPAYRAAAIPAANPDYRQVMIPGVDHFFQGHEAELLKAVSDWLNVHQE